jgi:outer membrane protein TolC
MQVRFLSVAILLAIAPATRAFAQDQPPATPELKLDLQTLSSGRMSLSDSIAIALSRNPALVLDRMRFDAATAGTQAERGTFEPVLNVSRASYRRDNIVASRFYPTGLYVDAEDATRVSVEAKTFLGGTAQAGIDYRKLTSTSNIQTLSPQYSANLVFGVSQPLLRDFGYQKALSAIRLSEQRALSAKQSYLHTAARLITQTEEEYWRWAFAREQADVTRRSRDAAARLLTQADTLFGAGKAAPSTVQQARAALAQREEDAIAAAADADTAEDRLKVLLRVDFGAPLTPSDTLARSASPESSLTIVPTAATISRPGSLSAAPLDPAASLASALRRRPELIGLERERDQREIELSIAKNQLLPRLDLTAQYMRSGMAGLPSAVCVDPTADECVPAGTGVENSIFASLLGPRDALDSLLTRSPFDGWSAELRLQVPLGMRTAKARRTEAELKLAQSRLQLEAARDEIARDVRETVRQAATAQARLDAARQVATYARTQFTTARTQLDAGLASTFDVVRTQDDLDRAMLNEIKAQVELNIALARVRLADMTVLDDHPIAATARAAAGTK